MKYLFLNGYEVEEFNTKEEAIQRADSVYSKMSDFDKKHLNFFYVLESVDPNPESEDHFNGNLVKIYRNGFGVDVSIF